MRRITFPLYVGGFLGPFGGAMLVAIIPNVAHGLDASVTQVAAAITAYMVPFAVLQLFSGTLAERLGPRRVVRAGYIGFGAAALGCALAPEIWSFLAARAVMGASNAFLSPILLAALSEVVAPAVLGRTVGTFAAAQTAGLTFAPILGGVLGEINWRLAFVLVAVVSVVLALPKQTLGAAERAATDAPRASFRTLLNRWIALLATQAMLGYLGFTAIGFVLVLVAADEFALGSSARGLLVAGYGIGGILLRPVRRLGRRPDRAAVRGARRGRRLHGGRGRPRLRADRLGPRARLLRHRVCVDIRLGRPEHDRGGVLPGEPRRRDVGLQRVQVRGRRDRAAPLRPALPRRHPPAVRARGRLLGAPGRAHPPVVRSLPVRRRVVVHGLVQGVFFRETVRRHAQSRGVAGWVRNNPDGTVEAVFEGGPEAVERLVAFVHEGPSGAIVERVDVVDEQDEGLSGFSVR